MPINDDKRPDYIVSKNLKDLPMDGHPAYLKYGVNGICMSGSALFNVHYHKRRVTEGSLVIILPYQLASVSEISDDFSMIFFTISGPLYLEVISGLCKLTPDFFFWMRSHFTYKGSERDAHRFVDFCEQLEYRSRLTQVSQMKYRRETVQQLLQLFYWDLYLYFKSDPDVGDSVKYTRKEELALRFFCLIVEHHTENREVAFYADKLCISPKYLTMLIRDVVGKSAKDWIVELTVLEIKSLLRDPSLDMKEIFNRTRFPSQSLLSRFFRKHTGVSPTMYREQVLACGNHETELRRKSNKKLRNNFLDDPEEQIEEV